MAAGGQRRRVRGRSPPSLPHTLPLGTVGRGPGSARFPPGVTAAEGGPEGSGAASRTAAAQPLVHGGRLPRCRRLHGGSRSFPRLNPNGWRGRFPSPPCGRAGGSGNGAAGVPRPALGCRRGAVLPALGAQGCYFIFVSGVRRVCPRPAA